MKGRDFVMNEEFRVLSNGVKMPSIGFGTYKSGSDEETAKIIKYALETGYRQIDTASFYGNEVGIGNGIKQSNIKREEIFLVTKLWNDDHGYKKTIEAFNKSLERLQVEYIDLYLIHWPNKLNAETWRAFEDLYKEGKVKAIGVCNFKIGHLEELKKTAEIMPMVNQVELHPQSSKEYLLDYCNDNNIQLVAWSPIMRGRIFSNELIIGLSEKYKKTIAQIVLRWHIQRGIIPIPKSSNEGRIKENLDIFDFELSADDMNAINSLNEGDSISVSTPPQNSTYLEFDK
ncbi:glyoxal reductase [Clostridium celatum DSM 1785]|uniref:Glyoxal reductase n=2 Tax=Clostridium celatum TaxID=36834 RepID=L1QFK7_9CLOT|nr:glyoxal reductase [Clostridium celatum DSM 1785]